MIVGTGKPADYGRDAEAVAEALQTGLGPSMPATSLILAIFRWAVARDQGQRGLPAAFAGVEQSAWTNSNSKAQRSSGGAGTSR